MAERTHVTEFFDSLDDFQRLLEDAERQAVSKWEQDFVADFQERFEVYGESLYLTIAQIDKLREISE